jgi:hypothetical protein
MKATMMHSAKAQLQRINRIDHNDMVTVQSDVTSQ